MSLTGRYLTEGMAKVAVVGVMMTALTLHFGLTAQFAGLPVGGT